MEWKESLRGDAKADALVIPFVKGEMVTPGKHCDTLPKYLNVPPH